MLLMSTRSCLDGRWCLREGFDMADSMGRVPKKGDKIAITVEDANKGVLLVCLEHCSRLYRGVLLDCTDGMPPVCVYRPGSVAVENPRQLPDRSPGDLLTSATDGASCCKEATPAQHRRTCRLEAVDKAAAAATISPTSVGGAPLSCDAAVISAPSSSPTRPAGAAVCRRPAKNRYVRNRMLRPRQTMCFKCQSRILDVSNDDISDASNDAGKKRKPPEDCNLPQAAHKKSKPSEVSPHIKISFSSPNGQDVVEIASKPLAAGCANPSTGDDDEDGAGFSLCNKKKKKRKGRHKRKKRTEKRRTRSEPETSERSSSDVAVTEPAGGASENETGVADAVTRLSLPGELRLVISKPMQGVTDADVKAGEKSIVSALSEHFSSACNQGAGPTADVINTAENATSAAKDAANYRGSHIPRCHVQNAKVATASAANLSERVIGTCRSSSQPSALVHVGSDIGTAVGDATEQPLITRVRTRNVPVYLHSDGRPIRVGDVVWGKISGFPWWPGRVTAITVSENDSGIVYAYVAHVAWFASKTSSNISCSDLYPFVEHFASRFNRRKKGPYKNAVRLAKMAVLCRSSASANPTLPDTSGEVAVREHGSSYAGVCGHNDGKECRGYAQPTGRGDLTLASF